MTVINTAKKPLRRTPKRGDTVVGRAAKRFKQEHEDVALALDIMRNTRLARPQPRYRSGRLTYRSF